MKQYYRVTAKMSFEDKRGNVKFKKENYLVSALSPADVEAKIIKHLGVEDFEIVGVNISNIIEVIL